MTKRVSPFKHLLQVALKDVTPIRLWLLFATAALGCLLFGGWAAFTVKQHIHALETVGSDAAPSVIAAHQIKIGVASMDGALADELLSVPGQAQARELAEDFEKNRLNVCRELVAAAKNITYGHAEQEPIENIQFALGSFDMQAQKARDLHQTGTDGDAVTTYRQALATLQEKILTNADDLNKANADVLEETYGREKSASALSRGAVLVLGMVLVGVLLYIHIYLTVHFRRRLNMPLILTMLILTVFLRYLTSQLSFSAHGLIVAKEDAYNSVLALLDARASAYLADSAQSRCLLDKQDIARQQKLFQTNMDRIATIKEGEDGRAILARAKEQLEAGQKPNLAGLSGALADELSNVRFEGERQAALDCLDTFLAYRDVSAREQKLLTEGKQKEALFIGLGYDPHGSNIAFRLFDDALVRTLAINQEELKHSVESARHALDYLFTGSIVLSIAMVIATYLGLRPRIQEYQVESYLHSKSPKKTHSH
jgi:hypothetical protein